MGALSGSITATSYHVEGEIPSDFRDRYVAALEKGRFKDIDLNIDQEESLGWVSMADPFDNEFAPDKILMNDYLVVGLRQDNIRLPAAAFKLHFRRALVDFLDRTGRERATKAEQEEVRDHLEKQLRKRVLPSIKINDMVWNLDRKELWFFTTNKRTNEVFMDLFTDTFELALIPRNPYTMMGRLGVDEEMIARSLIVEPTAFAMSSTKR